MKFKTLFTLPLLASMMLTGCKMFNKSSSGHSEPEIIEPVESVLESIAISGEFKTEYEVGEEFDASGIIVTASYEDESSKDVTSETTFSGFDSSVAGPCVVTASYEDKTASIDLTIVAHVYSVEEVAGDIGELIGRALNDKGTYWGITLNFSEDGVDYSNTQAEEDVLYPVAATLAMYYMPEYLEILGAKYFTSEEDFWEDESGDTAYYVLLGVDEVSVDIIAYCYSGYLLGQIAVY